jgi:hypothetical protein
MEAIRQSHDATPAGTAPPAVSWSRDGQSGPNGPKFGTLLPNGARFILRAAWLKRRW